MTARLDVELVRRGLARSRRHAADLVASGRVRVGGHTATKPARSIPADAPVRVDGGVDYASRAGGKLADALAAFTPRGLAVAGRRALDAGASTGGFTDVLLRAGVASVVAVDVGHDQLAGSLRAEPRVRVMEGVNARDLDAGAIGGAADVVVADLSFISLRLVLPALARCGHERTDYMVLVKPQFEVGRDAIGTTGVVRSPALRASAVHGVVDTAHELGLGVRGLVRSTVPGAHGNVEYVLWLRPGPDEVPPDVITAVIGGSGRGAHA